MAQEFIPFLVRLDPELHAELKAAAAAEERSMAQTIRRALWAYVKTTPKPKRR